MSAPRLLPRSILEDGLAMFRLELFGGIRLTGPGGPLSGRVVQRRQLAMLARIAGEPGGRISRDKLIGALWPETGQDRARHLLSDSLYNVRAELGEDAIAASGEELRLDPMVVEADVRLFREAFEAGNLEEALDLYRGSFLDGFFYEGSEEFDRWAGETRRALERHASEAASRLVAEHEDEEPFEAARWARRALSIDATDEPTARRLMELLDGVGDRAGALLAYEDLARALEEEIGVAPAPETVALAEGIRSRDQPRSEARSGPPSGAPDAERTAPDASSRSARPARSRGPVRGSVLLIVLVGLALASLRSDSAPAGDPGSRPRLAVLPFANLSGDAGDEYLSDGVANDIITRLARVDGLRVLSRSSMQVYEEGAEPLPEIAETLGATHVLEGAVQRDGDRIRITAQLIDATTDEHLWAARYDRDLDDLLTVQSDVAERIASALPGTLTAADRQRLVKRPTTDPEAWVLYLRGRHIWSKRAPEDLERSIDYFEEAIAGDPTFAAAWAGLADAHWLLGWNGYRDEERAYREAERAATRALQLDPSLAEAHTTMSWVHWVDPSWPDVERSLRRAIELNPSYATARHWYSHLLIGQGRVDEAVEEIRLAQELDPVSPVIAKNVGVKLFLARRYPEALEAFRRGLELNAEGAWAHAAMGVTYAQLGRFAEARERLHVAIDLAAERGESDATFRAQLAAVEARAGRHDRGVALLREAESGDSNPFEVAIAHLALGDADGAFEWLERVEWKFPPRGVRADPRLDPLRDDPRFARLSAEIDRSVGIE